MRAPSQGYRVDVCSEAGDRWDVNLTGFRAELEIGFNAASLGWSWNGGPVIIIRGGCDPGPQ